MADIFLNSVDGSDANSGADWSNEKLTLATGIAGIDAAGDRVLINSGHTEGGTTMTYTCPGTAASPCQLLSVTPTGASGISALTAGAVVNMSGTTFNVNGSFYAYGITWRSTSASSTTMTFAGSDGSVQKHESCAFEITGAGTSSGIFFGYGAAGAGTSVEVINSTFKVAHTAQRVLYVGEVKIKGGSWASGGTSPTACFEAGFSNRGANLVVEGFDFTNAGTSVNVHGTGQGGAISLFRDCLLAASWTGAPISDANAKAGHRVELWHYKIGTTWHRFWVKDARCQLTPETTIVRSGGGADSEGSYAVKMVTTANCAYPTAVARSMEFGKNNTTTGSSITVSMEIIRDSATALDDDEVWLEVEEPDGTITTDAAASVIATPAAQTSSSETWTTTGMTNPNKQTLSVTINASVAGRLLCRVMCAKPSTTLYICPKVTVA